MAVKLKVNLHNILLTGIFFVVSFTVLDWNNPSEAALLDSRDLFKKFTVWSKRLKKGLIMNGTKVSVDLTGEIKNMPITLGLGTLLYTIDPPAGKRFDDRITLIYDSTLLNFDKYGWFGDWGIDFSLPPAYRI